MNQPPFDTIGDEPVEARIVAWVLGESSAFEAAELERLCEERPELLVFRRRMRALHGLLTEAEAAAPDHSWKLPPEKRKLLDEICGEETVVKLDRQQEKRVRHSSRRAFLAIAACLLLTLIVGGIFSASKASVQKARRISHEHRSEKLVNFMPASGGGGGSEATQQSLDKAVQDQEDKVEEGRKALATIVRTKSVIYKGQDSFYGPSGADKDQAAKPAAELAKNDTREEAIQRGLDAQNYVDAKREFETDQQLLQSMKLKQINQRITQQMEAESIVALEPTPRVESKNAKASAAPSAGAGSGAGGSFAMSSPRPSAPKENARQLKLAKQPSASQPLAFAEGKAEPAMSAADAPSEMEALPAIAAASGLGGDASELRDPRPRVVPPSQPVPTSEKLLASGSAPSSRGKLSAVNDSEPPSEILAGSSDLSAADRFSADDQALTNGLRSGDQAINRNNIDAILNNPSRIADRESDSKRKKAEPNEKLPVLAGKDWGSSRDRPESAESEKDSSAETPLAESDGSKTEHAQAVDQVRRNLFTAEDNYNHGKYDDAEKAFKAALEFDGYNSAARRGLAKVESAKSDYYRAAYDNTRAELLGQVDSAWELSVPSESPVLDAADEEPLAEVDEAQTNLTDLIEEIPATENPYSTFSLNISDASFQLAKAALAKGERPDPASIKPEQFYNAVDYGDPAPASNEPVSATIEQAAHPIIPARNLVRVALRTGSAGRSAAQPLRLTLLVDQSGSMVREDRRAAMDHALSQLAGLLTKTDLVTVIGFSRIPHLLAEATPGDEAGKFADLINQTASEGGTNLEEAMKLGGQMAARHQLAGAQNRIVLFTDGAANLGDANPERLAAQVKSFRQKGIAFDIAGIGADGLNDRLLSELARNGNGRYYVVSSENNDSFARQLAGAFRPAAENVKVQVNFNPQRVGKYKLIGFEKDRLKTEDFRNDAVDAAELAAEEAGVAIYQVEPLGDGTGELGEVSVRFRDAASGQMVERAWTIPYTAQATAFDRATPSMQLAGLSLLAAEKLKGGPLADAIDFKQLTGSSAFVKQFYGSSLRVSEMLQVIEKLK